MATCRSFLLVPATTLCCFLLLVLPAQGKENRTVVIFYGIARCKSNPSRIIRNATLHLTIPTLATSKTTSTGRFLLAAPVTSNDQLIALESKKAVITAPPQACGVPAAATATRKLAAPADLNGKRILADYPTSFEDLGDLVVDDVRGVLWNLENPNVVGGDYDTEFESLIAFIDQEPVVLEGLSFLEDKPKPRAAMATTSAAQQWQPLSFFSRSLSASSCSQSQGTTRRTLRLSSSSMAQRDARATPPGSSPVNAPLKLVINSATIPCTGRTTSTGKIVMTARLTSGEQVASLMMSNGSSSKVFLVAPPHACGAPSIPPGTVVAASAHPITVRTGGAGHVQSPSSSIAASDVLLSSSLPTAIIVAGVNEFSCAVITGLIGRLFGK
ncbi:hypothetical protein BAE44_0016106 [Dichanthelium oligosanthes]|uniref:Uncharacterized protein n=1 Tax=Dichanthelium oligosanthes TaxID=888268 RepID=A0A1E5VCK7_9POAL|nr:hypothetical protein BAE44_0016106 [Dichanthelium oligosanthes]